MIHQRHWRGWVPVVVAIATAACSGARSTGADAGESGCAGLPSCERTLGVCANKTRACVDGTAEPVCAVKSYGPEFELVETSCDGLDNDCDGRVDVIGIGGRLNEGWPHLAEDPIFVGHYPDLLSTPQGLMVLYGLVWLPLDDRGGPVGDAGVIQDIARVIDYSTHFFGGNPNTLKLSDRFIVQAATSPEVLRFDVFFDGGTERNADGGARLKTIVRHDAGDPFWCWGPMAATTDEQHVLHVFRTDCPPASGTSYAVVTDSLGEVVIPAAKFERDGGSQFIARIIKPTSGSTFAVIGTDSLGNVQQRQFSIDGGEFGEPKTRLDAGDYKNTQLEILRFDETRVDLFVRSQDQLRIWRDVFDGGLPDVLVRTDGGVLWGDVAAGTPPLIIEFSSPTSSASGSKTVRWHSLDGQSGTVVTGALGFMMTPATRNASGNVVALVSMDGGEGPGTYGVEFCGPR